jgi:transposase-like protein
MKSTTHPKENTMITFTREQLKTAYLVCFDTFATDATEVASVLDVKPAEATKILKTVGPLLVSDHTNGERKLTWQCYETYDSITRDEAIELFDAAFPLPVEVAAGDDRNHATGPRYTDEQLAQAAEMRNTTDLSWAAIAKSLGIKTPYRLAKKVKAAGLEVRTERATKPAKQNETVARLETLLRKALAEKRTSGSLKAEIRVELGI